MRPTPVFGQRVWMHVVDLLAGAEAHDRSAVAHAMDAALALPRGQLVALKQALRLGIWCNVSALLPGPIFDDSLDRLAWTVYPATNALLNVPADTLAAVMGDALRIMDEEQATYSVKEGEFILVATVLLAELLAVAPATATDLDAIHSLCELAFSTTDAAAVQEAWRARLAADP